jgi:hypothetical protein
MEPNSLDGFDGRRRESPTRQASMPGPSGLLVEMIECLDKLLRGSAERAEEI